MLRYFAYGANIDPMRMTARVPEAVVLGPGYVERYGVEFTIRDREWGGGVLNAREDPDRRLWGLVYEGPEEAFAVLDTFQGDTALLEKAHVTVFTDAGPVEAITYRVIPIANYVRPSDRYLAHLTRAMKAQGLPPEAVQAVLDADRDAGETSGPSILS
ncbi:MAG TPA: gamma-glutamylcyclotransferase [Candidatus Angelobacter sp.]|nr:gamma-glutamylcyclotransferase [Candidatus Angelobacter sp.]